MIPYLKPLQELIRNLAGKNTEVIAELLMNKKDINEFKLANKLCLTINQTRNILYKLHAQNILSFIRKKDKSKGWYVYYYTLNTKKALEKLIDMKNKEIEILQHQLTSRESKRFFSCPSGCLELNEETALLHNFLCPECGKLLQLAPHEQVVAEIKDKIEKVKKEIVIVQQEIGKIAEKEEKLKERRAKKKVKAEAKKKGKAKAKRTKIRGKKGEKERAGAKKTKKKGKELKRKK